MADVNLPEDQDDDVKDQDDEGSGDEHEGHEDEATAKQTDGDDSGDDGLDGEDDDEREAIRERRRQERARKKAQAREREDSLRREVAARDHVINELNGRISVIERRSNGNDLAQLDNSIKQASDAAVYFKGIIGEATVAQNGAAVAEATERMIMARQEAERLNDYKKAITQQSQKPAALDPRLQEHKRKFMAGNAWFDSNGGDDDSRVLLAIDDALAKSGYNPTTPQYWEELEARKKKYLPHRTNDGSVQKVKNESRRSVVTGSGRESSSVASNDDRTLSEGRKQALKDFGAYDDPVERAKWIKVYREHDKANKSS